MLQHPIVPVFLKLTALIAGALVLFALITFVLNALAKIVLIAAVVAAVVLGGLYLYQLIRRRSAKLPAGR